MIVKFAVAIISRLSDPSVNVKVAIEKFMTNDGIIALAA